MSKTAAGYHDYKTIVRIATTPRLDAIRWPKYPAAFC